MTNQKPDGTFFDPHQRVTIEAAMARIIPTDDSPGAREACTIDFVDRFLSGIDYIYALPDGSGFEKLKGRQAEAWLYRIKVLQAKYVAGIIELDRLSQSHFETDFVALNSDQQDRILTELEQLSHTVPSDLKKPKASAGYGPAEPALQQTSTEIELEFFPLLALHTRQGFYSDPIYGGNKNLVGWKMIGFEGPTSLAESHAGRYTTLTYFAKNLAEAEKERNRGTKA